PRLRIYRTGDVALRRPDGLIEFIGRRDQQIKLSGHRIELGDVESALKACHGVRDAAVIAALDDSGLPQHLVAFCEPEPGATAISPSDLNASLVDRLPLFMVPRSIRILDSLPRLANLKIDREALRRQDGWDQEQRAAAPSAAGDEPGGAIRATLLQLWRDVLGRQDIG